MSIDFARSEHLVLAIVAVCTLISVGYLIFALITRSSYRVVSGFIMLLCPLVGQIFYFGAFVSEIIRRKGKPMQLEDISFSKEQRGRLLAPNYEDEIQTVPLEEVLIVSQNADKRKRLLRELKREELLDYSMLVKALNDPDPETVHYAASAISGAKTDFENRVRALDSIYTSESGPKDMQFVRQYAGYVLRFLRCGILSKAEKRKYSYLYIHILSRAEQAGQELEASEYANIVDEYIELEEFTGAKEWALKAFDREANEVAYLMLAKVYYYTGLAKELEDIIDKLRKSDLPLSREGLDLVRFFMRKARASS